MVSVSEAIDLIKSTLQRNHPATLPIEEAAGSVLAEDVYARYDIPGFSQSAMDGYAIRFDERNDVLDLQDETAAGDSRVKSLLNKNAMWVFTGAPVPDEADTVVMQERVLKENGNVVIKDEQLLKGKNIRDKGSEIAGGKVAMRKNSLLTPAAIGFLAGIGIDNVRIYPSPSVCIIVTGNEFLKPGAQPVFGKVYESNSFALESALMQIGIKNIHIKYVLDDKSELYTTLNVSLERYDMILLTGGISVGKYDFVLQAATKCGIKQIFHKVNQKPGKPLYFGVYKNIPVFGLPGNPSAALICFYEYVLTSLETLTGKSEYIKKIKAQVSFSFDKRTGLSHFLKGVYIDGIVHIPDAQESYKMSSFALANCLIYIPEEIDYLEKESTVEVHLFPV